MNKHFKCYMGLLLLAFILDTGVNCLTLHAAHSAPPPGADPALAPWFHDLKQPGKNTSCCDWADCRPVTTRIRDGQLEAYIDSARFYKGPDDWMPVADGVILHGHDNPVGEPVACFAYKLILCFVEGPGT